jgi:broad specificity phosphatase PhoE
MFWWPWEGLIWGRQDRRLWELGIDRGGVSESYIWENLAGWIGWLRKEWEEYGKGHKPRFSSLSDRVNRCLQQIGGSK